MQILNTYKLATITHNGNTLEAIQWIGQSETYIYRNMLDFTGDPFHHTAFDPLGCKFQIGQSSYYVPYKIITIPLPKGY